MYDNSWSQMNNVQPQKFLEHKIAMTPMVQRWEGTNEDHEEITY
jgi:hypothetical protein